jgi:hypothetical protein
MKFGTIICATLVGIVGMSSQSLGQQKTAKACQAEWRANKADNQARGITEKAYVDQCRAGGAPTQPAAVPAPQIAPPPAPTATAPPRSPAPSPTTAAPDKPTATARPAPSAAPTPAGANQFATEAQAKARCPTDTVVWANIPSRIYHFSGTHNYGNTKSGAYMCERDTAAAGYRAAKNESHP